LNVGLDDLDPERELLEDVIEELDGGLLVVARVDPQHPDPGAIVDRGVLVVLLAGARKRFDELHIDLHAVARQRLLVALPPVGVAFVPLRRRQPVEIKALEDPVHARVADLDVVVALEIHRDLQRPEVVVLAQVDDLADHLAVGLVRVVQGP
jgi:hypothetical protein